MLNTHVRARGKLFMGARPIGELWKSLLNFGFNVCQEFGEDFQEICQGLSKMLS